MEKVRFHLSKWYLDCVAEAGEPFLAYRAELQWGPLHLHYASALGGRTSLRKQCEPTCREDAIEWDAPALGVNGRWEPLDPPLCETFLGGAADWHCVAPRAHAMLVVNGRRLSGLGYVERLILTQPPWQLPLTELRWGRFLSETDAVAWIECLGPRPEHAVWHNGRRCTKEPELAMEETRALREGALGKTVLSAIPNASKVFPARILSVRESKWLTRASLGGHAGWAVHESVKWR